MSEKELIDRAIMAYHQRCVRKGFIFQQPNKGLSEVDDNMIVLSNCNGVLGKYRITAKGLRFAEDTNMEGQPHV